MAADFDKPTVSNTHVNVLPQIIDNQTSLARMFSDGGEVNVPLRSVRFLNNIMYLWNGSIWEVAPVAIGGGGTGAETSAAARTSLGTNVATNITSGVFDTDRIPTISIADKTSGTLDGDRVDQSTTSERGTVQLNNTLTSTSTAQALTAAQGKALKDTADSLASTVSGKQNQIFAVIVVWQFGVYDSIGFSFSRASAGRITMTHNKSNSNAVFFANSLDSSVNISFNNAQANTIDIAIDNVVTNTAVDSSFFILDVN